MNKYILGYHFLYMSENTNEYSALVLQFKFNSTNINKLIAP